MTYKFIVFTFSLNITLNMFGNGNSLYNTSSSNISSLILPLNINDNTTLININDNTTLININDNTTLININSNNKPLINECFGHVRDLEDKETEILKNISTSFNARSEKMYITKKNYNVSFNDNPNYLTAKKKIENNMRRDNAKYEYQMIVLKKEEEKEDEKFRRMPLEYRLNNINNITNKIGKLRIERDEKNNEYRHKLHTLFGKMIVENNKISDSVTKLLQEMVDSSYKEGNPIEAFVLLQTFYTDGPRNSFLIGFSRTDELLNSEVKPYMGVKINTEGNVVPFGKLYFEYGQVNKKYYDKVVTSYDASLKSGWRILVSFGAYLTIASSEKNSPVTMQDVQNSEYGIEAPAVSPALKNGNTNASVVNLRYVSKLNQSSIIKSARQEMENQATVQHFKDVVRNYSTATEYLKILIPSAASALVGLAVGYCAFHGDKNLKKHLAKVEKGESIFRKFLSRYGDYKLDVSEKSDLKDYAEEMKGGVLQKDEITSKFKLGQLIELAESMSSNLLKIQFQNLEVLDKMISNPDIPLDDFINQFNKYLNLTPGFSVNCENLAENEFAPNAQTSYHNNQNVIEEEKEFLPKSSKPWHEKKPSEKSQLNV